MKVKIHPGFAKGNVTVPPSKSLLHRAIICACLATGESKIRNVVYSEDVKATINAFKTLGVDIERKSDFLNIKGNVRLNFLGAEVINCNESGSTILVLVPLLTNEKGIYLTGKPSLMRRPLHVYEELFKQNNLVFERKDKSIYLKNSLPANKYEVPGNISSQFISGLLMSLPLKEGDSEINIIGNLESKKYVDMTIDVMKSFGVNVEERDNSYFIKGKQKYQATNYLVEIDFSQLAFFAVAGVINGDIQVNNVNLNSLQADKAILDVIKEMGGIIIESTHGLKFRKSETKACDIDVSQFPDIAPILTILCGLSKGTSTIFNAERLRIKETDRLMAINDIMRLLGVKTEVFKDSYKIYGNKQYKANSFSSYNDHRMVMSIAIAALRADGPVIINDAEAINKSYPDFFEDLQSLGINIEYM